MVENTAQVSARAEVRRLLAVVLITDADLVSFCLDYFPEVHRRFSDSMDRLSRTNLLLEMAPPAEIVSKLTKQAPGAAVSFGASIARILGDQRQQRLYQLESELEAALRSKEELIVEGGDSSEIDQKILAIRRAQRCGSRLNEGEILSGRYKLLQIVGTGGFADVWQALDRRSKRLVAIKALHPQWNDDRSRMERFERGARRMAELRHPNIVEVLSEPLEDQGFVFFVMEYLGGGDLGSAILFHKYTVEEMLRNVIEVGVALERAHQNGLIHRDVKPQNIILDAQKKARLTDFDLVGGIRTTGGTRAGGLGTFIYAAPEQMDDASNVDHRADIYSLGMVTLSVLFGREIPFRAIRDMDSFIESIECSRELMELMHRATNWDPDVRHCSAAQFCNDLQMALRKPKIADDADAWTIATAGRRKKRGKFEPDWYYTSEGETSHLLEGVWKVDDGTTFCIKRIDGVLRCAYCYGDVDSLTGHIFGGSVLGDQLLGRFRWIDPHETHGYIYLRLVFADTLMGGWCYAEDLAPLKEENIIPIIQNAVKSRHMVTLAARRVHKDRAFPSWAEEYFDKQMWLKHS